MAGEAAEQAESASATSAQQALRANSADFAAHAEEAGWADPGQTGGAVRETIDVLLHGRSADREEAEARLSPAAVFIQSRAYDIADPQDVAASLAAEVREARIRVRAVNAAAAQVVLGPARPVWSRREDVRAAETVVQLARQAKALFRDVSAEVDDRLDRDDREVLRREMGSFEVELARLSAAADALSAPRPDGVNLEDVDVIAGEPDIG